MESKRKKERKLKKRKEAKKKMFAVCDVKAERRTMRVLYVKLDVCKGASIYLILVFRLSFDN